MAEPQFADDVTEDGPADAGDVEMEEGTEVAGEDEPTNGAAPRMAEDGVDGPAVERIPFITYLASPVVTLIAGTAESESILTAHQSLLTQSPYFRDICAEFANDGSPRQIDLAGDDVDAVGAVLEFLYTGDYFPRKIPGQRQLESDPSIPKIDETGTQLLKHARIYTLADKFQLPKLKQLATSKIHCVSSTAKGEIAYARYVYAYTTPTDTTIRAPVANFWATRSHTLRSEAEADFRALCLEFPQFGYDVLTRVLDEKLKREKIEKLHPAPGSVRKRPRHSNV